MIGKEFTRSLQIKDYVDQRLEDMENASVKFILAYGFFYLLWNIWRELAEIAGNTSHLRRVQ